MTFRKAKMADVEELHALINDFAEKGVMLARSRNTLYETIREFMVVEDEGKVVGAGALHIIWEDLAEIRALAIRNEYQRKGIGKKLIDELIKEAIELGIHKVFALTYQVDFFRGCGFQEVSKDEMPHKVWKECINCPKFPNCDEVAVIRRIG
ncbi:MAG TPA: N-acetyltransferase [Bacillota bacterium]|nr:N-acetyltransferase [Bacillota bacterium]HPT87688.1 N-acetyltransferase [Bacillota bacterium]